MELTWAFESSMDQLDSMNARGYGTVKRSHFHLFRLENGRMFLAQRSSVFDQSVWFLEILCSFLFYPEVRGGI